MNILLTSAGRRTYLVKYFKEVLNGLGKVHASNSQYTIALQEADQYFISPLIYEENYIASIIDYCLKNSITVVISVFDIDLLVLSKAKKKLSEHGIRLILSNEEIVEMCNDKWETYLWLKEHNIKTPKTFKNIHDLHYAIENNEINFPIIMKPRWGMASMGIYVADNNEELNILYKKSLNDIKKSYLKLESSFTPDEQVIFQEILVGKEYGLDIINDLNGNFTTCIAKQKVLMRAGETDLGLTCPNDRFLPMATLISKYLKHECILSVDCFIVDNEIFIIEMNCRISGHYPISHESGVNLPKQIIKWINNEPTDLTLFSYEKGIYITKDLTPVILHIPDENKSNM